MYTKTENKIKNKMIYKINSYKLSLFIHHMRISSVSLLIRVPHMTRCRHPLNQNLQYCHPA